MHHPTSERRTTGRPAPRAGGTSAARRRWAAVGMAALFWLASPAPPASAADSCFDAVGRPHIVLFAPGSARIAAADRIELQRLAEAARGAAKVCVIGQADRQGNAALNLRLGLKRAEAVAKLLIRHGVPASIIEVQSRGEAFGAAAASSAADRRVEIALLAG